MATRDQPLPKKPAIHELFGEDSDEEDEGSKPQATATG
jgi:hypothetical protein